MPSLPEWAYFISEMNSFPSLALVGVCLGLVSCGSAVMPDAELSPGERSLLSAINAYRTSEGEAPLQASVSLTELAREDAQRRATEGAGYVDNRSKTGYERMLTLAGKARGGEHFGSTLVDLWKRSPIQKQWLEGNYSGVGVGSATEANGVATGVVLLGGFSGSL